MQCPVFTNHGVHT